MYISASFFRLFSTSVDGSALFFVDDYISCLTIYSYDKHTFADLCAAVDGSTSIVLLYIC